MPGFQRFCIHSSASLSFIFLWGGSPSSTKGEACTAAFSSLCGVTYNTSTCLHPSPDLEIVTNILKFAGEVTKLLGLKKELENVTIHLLFLRKL